MDKVAQYLIDKVAKANNLPPKVVQDIWESQFGLAREVISELDFNKVESEEEFYNIRGSFCFPALLKLYPKYKIFKRIKDKKNDKQED